MNGITLFFIIVGATVCALIASSKHRNVAGWAIAGALLPLIAIVIVACQSSLAPESPDPLA